MATLPFTCLEIGIWVEFIPRVTRSFLHGGCTMLRHLQLFLMMCPVPRPRTSTRHMKQNDDSEKAQAKNARAKIFSIFPIDKINIMVYNTYIKNNTPHLKEK
jgi:hypothetical protein